jgi:ribosomal protein L14E/L6E/L27E
MMKSNLIQVEGHPDLARDPRTNAIVNINKEKAAQRRKARDSRLAEREEFKQMKSDVNEIKAMLQKLLESNNNG